MKEEIEGRLRANLARVDGLVETYRRESGGGKGRRPVETVDLLRAAVVFLHATMEDVLRSVQAHVWRRTTSRDHLEKIDVVLGPNDPREKVTLADLLAHRGKTVDDLIRESVLAHLERASFNNVGDVKRALERSNLDRALVDSHITSLASMMARRHLIVHRADRQDVGGSGNHGATSLGTATVDVWKAAVQSFCESVVAQL